MTSPASELLYSPWRHATLFIRTLRRRVYQWFGGEVDLIGQSLALEEPHLPKLLKCSIVTLSGATFLFILWASFTHVKEVARTEGQVIPSGYNRLAQHLEGGLVREILVREGDFVQEGQILVRIDGAGTEEDLREQQARMHSLLLQQERLNALIEKRAPDFSSLNASKEQAEEQLRMHNTLLEAQHKEQAVLAEQVAQKAKSLERLIQTRNTAKANLAVAKESLEIYAQLSRDGLTTRTAYLKRQEEFNTRSGDVANLSRQIEGAQKELGEYRHRLEALNAQQRDNAYNELNAIKSELAQAKQSLKKRRDRVARLDVHSPVMGYVKGLKVNTVGAVIPAGQTLMEIVPVEEQLVVEVRIPPQQIGQVEEGQNVHVKVDSYDYVRYGILEGKLESISAMTFTDESRREDYYKGRVRLSRNYVGSNPGTHLIIPGMTVDADIITGEKSIMGYLFKPVRTALYNAMTEQ